MSGEDSDRSSTGIAGFDEMSRGGFPRNAINILTGRAGSGKTLFSIHYALEGAKRDERTVYISIDEQKEAVMRAADQYELDLRREVNSGKIQIYDYEKLRDKTGKGLMDFEDLTRVIDQLMQPVDAKRLIIDSIAGLGIGGDSINEIRRSLLRFIRRVRENEVTCLLVTEMWEDKLSRYGVEDYVGDSLVVLGLEQMQNQMSRSINIRKMRYTDHDTSFRPVEITKNGMVVHNQGQVF